MEEASGKHQQFSSDKSPPLLLMPISRVRSQAFLSVTDAWPEEPMSKVEEALSGNALGFCESFTVLFSDKWYHLKHWHSATVGDSFVNDAFNQTWFAFFTTVTALRQKLALELDRILPYLVWVHLWPQLHVSTLKQLPQAIGNLTLLIIIFQINRKVGGENSWKEAAGVFRMNLTKKTVSLAAPALTLWDSCSIHNPRNQ